MQENKKTASAGARRMLTGEVVSDKMYKRVDVIVERTFIHPLLKKVMRTSKKYKVHDADQKAVAGDIVEIYEGRPLSRSKYMYLSRIIKSYKE